MKRASFLKRLAGLLVAPKAVDLEALPDGWSDPLLDEFKDAGIHLPDFWFNRLLQEAWVEGRVVKYAICSPEALREIRRTSDAGIKLNRGELDYSYPMVDLYLSDFGTVSLLNARDYPWVELNEYGVCLQDEMPDTRHAVYLSGGPLNGRTMTFSHRPMKQLEFPFWDEEAGRTVRLVYEQVADRTWRYKP